MASPAQNLKDYAVPTRANTSFMAWWELLIAECASAGLSEPTFGPAKGYYECGYCPRTGAADFAVVAE